MARWIVGYPTLEGRHPVVRRGQGPHIVNSTWPTVEEARKQRDKMNAAETTEAYHTRLEADGTWTGVEIPDALLRALGWTAYPINGTPVVVRREGERVVIERDDEARKGPEDHG